MNLVVTIDGPAAAGKSTTARAVAARLGFLYVDTGALYRALALKTLDLCIRPEDVAAVAACAQTTRLELSGTSDHPRVWMDGQDVTEGIRTPEVSERSSRLAVLPAVRRRMVEIQRELRERGPLVAEGRDLGTVVFPDAEVKVFLDARLETRARRRHQELRHRGMAVTLEDVQAELERRDARDRDREESPLRPAADALVIDTTPYGVDDQVEAVLAAIQARLDQARARPER